MRLALVTLTTLAALAVAGVAYADANSAMQEGATTRKAAPKAPLPGAPPPKAGFTATVSPLPGATANAATKAPDKKEEAKKE